MGWGHATRIQPPSQFEATAAPLDAARVADRKNRSDGLCQNAIGGWSRIRWAAMSATVRTRRRTHQTGNRQRCLRPQSPDLVQPPVPIRRPFETPDGALGAFALGIALDCARNDYKLATRH